MIRGFATTAEKAASPTMPWWFLMIAGIAAVIGGLLLLSSPAITLVLLVQFLGIYWLVTGILSVASIFIDRTLWGWKLFVGVLGILAGLVVIRDPLWSAILVPGVLVIFLAIEALFMGGAQVFHAFRGGGFGLALLGVLNIIFGIILLSNPLIGVIALPIVIGIFAVVGGAIVAIRAFTTRHQEETLRTREM